MSRSPAIAPGPVLIGLAGPELLPEERSLLLHPGVAGVILFARNCVEPEQIAGLCAAVHSLRDPPLLVTVDQEGGRVQRCRTGFTALPSARAIARAVDGSGEDAGRLAWAVGLVLGAELRAVGIDWSFTPVLDLDPGRSAVIGDRAFGSDPERITALASGLIDGLHEAGLPSTGKHFPGHGWATADSHHVLPEDERDWSEINDRDLVPYRKLIAADRLDSIMTAHVRYPAVDPAPASYSRHWIAGRLRTGLGFDGLVVADDLGMAGAAGAGSLPDRAVQALAAGNDLVMVCNDPDAVPAVLERAVACPNPDLTVRLARLRARASRNAQAPRLALARDLMARIGAEP